MKMKKKEKQGSRRDFLKLGLTVSAGAAAGAALLANTSKGSPKSGHKVKLLTEDGQVVEVDKYDVKPNLEPSDRKESKLGVPGKKFVMVVDLAKCKNARKCVDDCQEGHHISKDQEWMRVYLLQDSPESAPYWFPRPCFHCDNPLCVSVCPVGATYKRSDGIVLVDTHRCIGCKFCMTGCPYSARVFHWKEPESAEADKDIAYSPETNIPAREGTVGKCVFCADKVKNGKLPRCVSGCPMGVIYFGDINEDTVTNGTDTMVFSELIRDRSGYRYHENLGTRPSVYYLPAVERSFPVERGYESLDDELKARYKNTPFVKKLENES
ncbi:MAG: 4Fe-4S dicluster domain-containing protein [Bacteroidetes bacterium]|jgi:molybdopterin-containing oxidoreductase family iron-sulfur binding subunit|nr:4Fe-4S dicluster domain-containing protein [Bacteroidota bacterium]MBT4339083.1 4Fe-4S dicluster domain-containing protein [Bacteroidota bacterium]MBT5529591.1 4Fe-4S dicluster domain-containing protein [Cytophagia bacterium]